MPGRAQQQPQTAAALGRQLQPARGLRLERAAQGKDNGGDGTALEALLTGPEGIGGALGADDEHPPERHAELRHAGRVQVAGQVDVDEPALTARGAGGRLQRHGADGRGLLPRHKLVHRCPGESAAEQCIERRPPGRAAARGRSAVSARNLAHPSGQRRQRSPARTVGHSVGPGKIGR